MTAKKTADKPKPPEVTDEKIAQWKAHTNRMRMSRKVGDYALDLDDLEKMVKRIEDQIPNPPPVISSVEVAREHQQDRKSVV